MSKTIGKAAGKLWAYLDKNKSASPSRIIKETGISKNDLQRAIGWLSREEKLIIEVDGRVETLSLKEGISD
ncbi:MAG: winged helix-turn-helix domain-containing protein [Methylococcales bacterium]|nr:winged helix-turn-helix domain-containing protein [Methylococcales bacterium]